MKNIFDIVKNNWWLILIGLWFVYSIFFTADRDFAGNVTKSGWINVDQLQAGDCILDNDLVEDAQIDSEDVSYYQYWATPCEQEHSAEVFYQYDLGDKYNEWPGVDILNSDIDEICYTAFENHIGLSIDEIIMNYPEESAYLDINGFYPLEDSWYLLKTLDCFVYNYEDELLIGSIKDLLR